MILFDIGANVGEYALANAQNFSTIISVEASPSTFKKLVNKTKGINIVCENVAISNSKEDFITFYECNHDTLSTTNLDWLTSSVSRFGHMQKEIRKISVPTTSLDTLIAKHGMPSLIKIDVEGAEDIVLASLSHKVPTLCFEWASEMRDVSFRCLDRLDSLGFTKYHIQLEDKYTYIPDDYYLSSTEVKGFLANTEPKKEWGMIWCK
jgi:FkbM family methyltransferase